MPHDGTNHPWYQGFTNIFGNMKELFSDLKLEDLKPQKPNPDDPLTKAFRDSLDSYTEMGANTPESIARGVMSGYLGIPDSTDILDNQAIVSVDDDGGISHVDGDERNSPTLHIYQLPIGRSNRCM